jgi:hypothetical protein
VTFDGATADKLLHRVAGHDERQAHRAIFAGLNAISTVRNTKADALLVAIEPKESWCVVYEYPDQARACRILIESAGDSQGAANQIQVVVQTEADGDGEALFDGFARARDEACCSR